MKKKGFTLIELLAVIIILAIIAVITVPMIMNVIEKAKKGALEDSAYGMIEAANLYYTQNINDGIESDITFIPDETKKGIYSNDIKLSYKGLLPETGSQVLLKTDGTVGIKIISGDYCAVKTTTETKVTLLKNDCTTSIDGGTTSDETNLSELQTIIGSTDVSSIADGTITGAIKETNDYLTYWIQNGYLPDPSSTETTLIPILTAISQDGYLITSNNTTGGTLYAPFDGNSSTYWGGSSSQLSINYPWHITIELPNDAYANKFGIVYSHMGGTFILQGSNDGTNFTDVSNTIKTQYVTEATELEITSTNTTNKYKYYRLLINGDQSSTWSLIYKIQIYGIW